MNNIEKSLELFKNGNSCAQAILEGYADRVDINPQIAVSIGAGLGGGVGRKQSICGAINAGAIILGLKHSSGISGDTESKDKTAEIVGQFVTECEQKLGKITCKELLNIDLSNPTEKAAAKESGLFDRVCDDAVRQTAIILEKYLTNQ